MLRTSVALWLIRYLSYPLIVGGTAAAVLAWLAAGWSYFPFVPATVIAALAAVAWLERQLPFHAQWLADHGDWRCDWAHAAVNLTVLLGVHGAIAALAPLWSAGTVWPRDWPLWAQALLAGAVLDLSLYAVHVASHKAQWLWRFHAIHHSSLRLYWLNGERRHPLHAAMMAGPGLVAVVLAGAPAFAVGAWLAILAVHLAFQHSNLDYRLGPLRYVLGAAEVHRWHHKREYEDAQVNFGEFWMIWDHLFGSFHLPEQPLGASEVGLREPHFPMTYFQQLRYPFAFAMPTPQRQQAIKRELEQARSCELAGDLAGAWRANELAHVLAQPNLLPHLKSHVGMLGLAWRCRSWTEVFAQLARLVLVPLAHASGLIPKRNGGTGRFGLLQEAGWPEELEPASFKRR
jgi:sterol desaturase/sphingolipid hydroxylase (fatty acid hydroxylase superfamily)